MKKTYELSEIEIIKFSANDVIETSGAETTNPGGNDTEDEGYTGYV